MEWLNLEGTGDKKIVRVFHRHTSAVVGQMEFTIFGGLTSFHSAILHPNVVPLEGVGSYQDYLHSQQIAFLIGSTAQAYTPRLIKAPYCTKACFLVLFFIYIYKYRGDPLCLSSSSALHFF
jgi:hypothetical protein